MTKKTFIEICKFTFVGGSVAILHIAFVYVLTSMLGMWYLLSSIISYACAIVLNFLLQKFFVRQNMQTDTMHSQFMVYVLVSLVHLSLNTLGMYGLVDFMGVPYLYAQAVIIGLLSFITFFVNRLLIFR